ncbi:MAG: UDP-N-acetylmuramoyl-L-alanyl-D-glutamate--2,6-diaminopimelate ligase [Deltaproteobacteria bacterium]|nr:UDP-N-acetylmuramoyl-L-alanyl-D-glutamate--2,6-diaminopimelate ligase [Deltaproteobacteria bacterium]
MISILLSKLLPLLDLEKSWHYADLPITGIAFNSKKVKPGDLFIAICGTQVDGHDYIAQALGQGAVACIVEKEVTALPKVVPILQVSNSRLALSHVANAFYQNVSEKLKIVGITGTNGKTTMSCLVQAILNHAGISCGRMGTIGYQYGEHFIEALHTTPESTEIHQVLAKMLSHGVQAVAMEVSSHAIDLHRVADVQFDVAVFSNLTPEHLDYHQDMETYFAVKQRLFLELLPRGKGLKKSIINADDPYGLKLIESLEAAALDYWSYSTHAQSKWDIFVTDWKSTLEGITAQIMTPQGELSIHSPLIGAFNLSNILAAISVAVAWEVPLAIISEALASYADVPGRLQKIENPQGVHVYVDYAHTPDALKNVLQTLRELNPPRLITVFGCGGDRDAQKRPIMGCEVAKYSDAAIVTSDNPRTEDPQQIIEDILPGVQEGGLELEKNCWVEPDRRQAIFKALQFAQEGDLVLIAGKGHEDYQILGKEKVHFDDREVVREFFK